MPLFPCWSTVTWALAPRILSRRSSSKPVMTPRTTIKAITPTKMPATEKRVVTLMKTGFRLLFR